MTIGKVNIKFHKAVAAAAKSAAIMILRQYLGP
jgi:hypothetical protein